MSDVTYVPSTEQLALRERLGAGARFDAPTAPSTGLLLARQGTAYFLRRLQELSDEDFDAPSRLHGWSRRHLIAHVGYHARAIARLVESARTGTDNTMYSSDTQRCDEINFGSTLPCRALRHLVEHSAIHLNVEWRDLTDAQWDHPVLIDHQNRVPVRETAWMRAREIWVRAADLGNGGSFQDFPRAMNDHLISHSLKTRSAHGISPAIQIVKTDVLDDDSRPIPHSDSIQVVGHTADLARWLVRGDGQGLTASDGPLPSIPQWF